MTTGAKLQLVLETLDEVKAVDINVIEVGDRTHLMDYVVVCSGTSSVHMRAISDRVKERLKQEGFKGVRTEGYEASRWILLDYGDIVLNVFDPQERAFYDLEAIWQKARQAVA